MKMNRIYHEINRGIPFDLTGPAVESIIRMVSGFKVETITKGNSLPSSGGLFKSSISKLSASTLAELCQRLRVQLIQQRLPIICPACRPNLLQAYKMELDLTRMLRALCGKCKSLFMAGPVGILGPRPIYSHKLITTLDPSKSISSPPNIKKVFLKVSEASKETVGSPKKIRTKIKVDRMTPSTPSPQKGRAHSFSGPLPAKRKYSKNLDHPLTPPPTPARGRKRRATADLVSEVLVCFEPDAVVRRPPSVKPIVFIPNYKEITFPPRPIICTTEEILQDQMLLTRHARYEEVEKTMRLCRPEVLRSLYNGAPISTISDDSSSAVI